jgi:hypothetical protein
MNDQTTTVEECPATVREFVDQRDWRRFHAPQSE